MAGAHNCAGVRRRCARPRRWRRGPGLAPGLVIAPVGDRWREKGGAVARLGVLGAEEVPAGTDFAHCFEREILVLHSQRPQELGDHREQFGVERHLLERSLQASLHPAGAVHEKIDAAHDRSPEREYAFVGRLRIERIGGVGVRGAVGDRESARELPAHDRRLHVLGRAERRGARFHVDVGGKAAINEGRARPHGLRHDEPGQRLRVLLRKRPGERHRRHGAGEGERGQHHDLIAPRHLDDALEHRRVEPQRRGRIDDREQRRLALERRIVDSARDLDHLDRVQVALAPEAVGVDRLVRQRQHVEERVEVADRGVNVDRLDRIAAPEMDRIEGLPKSEEVLVVAMIARPSSAGAIEGIGRARHGAEGDMAPADPQIARRVPRVQGEFLRREPDLRFDQRRIKSHALRARLDVGAGIFQHRARAVVQKVDPDFLQRSQRQPMDRFELVLRDEIERRERRKRLSGRRRRRSGGAPGAAPAPASGVLRLGFRGHRLPSGHRALVRLAGPRRAASRQIGIVTCKIAPARAYFAARSFGGSGAPPSSAGRPVGPAEKRAMSQERNNATASLLRSSGWVVK